MPFLQECGIVDSLIFTVDIHMRTPEFQAAVLGALQERLAGDDALLLEIKAAARAALDLSEAYPEELSPDALRVFAQQNPEYARIAEHPQG